MTRLGDPLPGTHARLLPPEVATRRANWIEVARTDLEDVRRSWMRWALGGGFALVLLLAPMQPILLFGADPSEIPFGFGFGPIPAVIWRLAPLAGLLVGCTAVVGERDAGSLRMLLGLPITRRDVVVGKLLARSAILVGALFVGLVLAGVELWFVYGPFDPGWYATVIGTELGYGLLFVWMGVGISAFVRSRAAAVGIATSAYALFVLAWKIIPLGGFYLVNGQYPGNVPEPWNPPAWLVFLGNANPVNGYFALVAELPLTYSPGWGFGGTSKYRSYAFEGSEPFYVQPEFVLVVLLVWVLGPLLVGTWRFSRSDLA